MTSITSPGASLDLPAQSRRRVAAIGLSLLRGRTDDAAWVRPAFWGVTLLATLLYVANLTVSGFANTYYSAAALAASQSWSAWFFGSIDASNFITVDKPPLSTMLMGLSVRLFGLSSWSVLLPEALAGVATVALLFVVVRRSFGPAAALIAALVAALTPAAVLIFRYNNPDALLTLLLVAAAWAFLRALEDGRTRWVILAAVFVGLAFNTKYLQAYLVLPAFALTYLVAAPGTVWRRLGALAMALVTVLVASGWWVLAVELIPAASRPFIGGSTSNSALDLLFGYDGLARIFGGGAGGVGGAAAAPIGAGLGGPGLGGPGGGAAGAGGPGGGFSGAAGLLRLFNAQLGGQVSWLIGFALLGLVSGLWIRRHTPRTDRKRAGYLMWGLWLLVHAAVFSFMTGIIHSYYTVAIAPAVGALVGAGVVELWSARSRTWWTGPLLGAGILGSAIWAWQLLDRTPDFAPGLGLVIVAVSAIVAVIVALPASVEQHRTQLAAVCLGVVMLLAGPATYAIDTMQTAYSGGDPAAGPTANGGFGGAFAGGGDGRGVTADSTLVSYLLANRGSASWIVATTSAQEASSIELASGAPAMAMGGFMGSDPAPTLAQFQALVAAGKVRYVLVSSAGGFGPAGQGSGSTVSAVNDWAASVGRQVTSIGNGTLYDLSALTTSS